MPKSEDDLVFPTDSGKPITLSNFATSAWALLRREAGLVIPDKTTGEVILRPKYSPYCLRHYQASKLIEKSKDAKYIQTFMGHSVDTKKKELIGNFRNGGTDHRPKGNPKG
jgi:integrase